MSANTQISKKANARKMMLWFGIVSLIMTFAGWTSAYIVSSSRADWMQDFQLPPAFWFSTVILVVSSITYWLAAVSIRSSKHSRGTVLLLVSLLLGIIFVVSQFRGFSQMIAYGYYFTGPTSNITLSYVFLISVVHILHVAAGLISLSVVLIQQLRRKYGPENMLGVELGLTFWNFVDILWLYLVFFFYLYQ
jgi:cytochrome c oxidase subunit 3